MQKILNNLKKIRAKHKLRKDVNHWIEVVSIKKNVEPLSNEFKKEIQSYYKQFKIPIKKDLNTFKFYKNVTGIEDVHFLPESLFFLEILPLLNNRNLVSAYGDKNVCEVFFPNFDQPKTIVKCINGFYYIKNKLVTQDNMYKKLMNYPEIVVKKALDGKSGGKDVEFLTNINEISVDSLEGRFGSNFIVQEPLKQHASLNNINPSSINTLRIFSYLKQDGEVIILSSSLRFGRKGSRLDNASSGGLHVGIDKEGTTKKIACDVFGKFFTSDEVKEKFANIKIPSFKETLKLIKNNHQQFSQMRFIAWDIAIDEQNKPILIEVNLGGPGIKLGQIDNGPIFGEYTDEILFDLSKKM
ncbi:sugar-transfer associated ATP-grasp domain-containing protein [Enterococcus sp. 22-H-5-01]|uniref:sugar-transfer associated ATP-grasp domain-containing protein n=1 Tax=Enterococcus sp. 22-H-5-01 TaxID=3418555 RepID=UPI003D0260DE